VTKLASRALCENCVLLTRDRDFVKRRLVEESLFLAIHDTLIQLRPVVQSFGLKPDNNSLLTRCLQCNIQNIEALPKESVSSAMPHYIYQTPDEYFQCSACKKFFWGYGHIETFQT